MAAPDGALLERWIAARDGEAFNELVSRHADFVYGVCRRIVRNDADAQDLTQECFLKLWRQPELYQAARGRLLPWLLGVTHHRAIDRLRRRKLEQRFSADGADEVPASSESDPEQRVWSKTRQETVNRALSHLPANQRVALELAYLRGMTQVEIAACLKEPLGTIKTRMRLAMQKLRAMPEIEALVTDAG